MKTAKLDPMYVRAMKPSLLHNRRLVLRFNEKELKAINDYCERYDVKHKATALRRIIIERVLKDLDENHPTLF